LPTSGQPSPRREYQFFYDIELNRIAVVIVAVAGFYGITGIGRVGGVGWGRQN
jgi:hypothetical protein